MYRQTTLYEWFTTIIGIGLGILFIIMKSKQKNIDVNQNKDQNVRQRSTIDKMIPKDAIASIVNADNDNKNLAAIADNFTSKINPAQQ